jgi:hypothetical protein
MYVVEDETFKRARSVVTAISRELSGQAAAGSRNLVDLQELVRRSADADVPDNGEAEYLAALATDLARLFPLEELFPRKRRARD